MTLQITRLRVEQLRRFRQPLELTGFEPGLNILCGPNEAGKSTLVRAIRAAFFERHKSTVVEDLRPWGEGSSAAPHIELDFLLDGQPHHLVKSFLGRKRCTLQIGARTLDGAEAEDHLAQRLGFSFAGKGASKPEHWGIPGLLWVEQGTGQSLDVSHARDHLHDALQGQVGAAASTLAAPGGDELLDQLRSERNALLTGTGKPRAAYLEAGDALADLQAGLVALDERIATYRDQVDRLANLRRDHQADEAGQPWDGLQRALAEARVRQQALQAGQAQLQADQARAAQLVQTRELLSKALESLAQQQAQADARAEALAQARAQLEAADAALGAARQGAEAAQARAARAHELARQVRQDAERQALQHTLAQAGAEAHRTAEALQRADAAHRQLLALREEAAATAAITPAQVQQLRRLERALQDAALQRQAVATRLQFTLPAGQSARLQAQGAVHTLQAVGEHLLDAPATLQLPGGGEILITPGGQDLAPRVLAHEQALEALQGALRAAGVADLAEADARLGAHQQRQARIQLAEQALAIVAPQGPEPLRLEAAAATARIRAAQAALAALAATAAAVAAPAPLDGAAPPAGLTVAQAEAGLAAALAAETAALTALAGAQSRQAGALSRRDAAQREHAGALATLADPARQARQAQAQQDLLIASAEAEALGVRIAEAAARLQAARPDIVAQDIERLGRSVEQLLRTHQQRREEILQLESTLRQAGAEGLEERREALAGELDRARRRHAELQARARALDLLCMMLDAKRRATLERLQAPLQARLQHYLPLLLPEATVQMDAGLLPGTLTRARPGGAPESGQVAELSFGAREQLGLISRFAYADLLQQAGRPTLLILDDALVHSDAGRLAQMKRVLFDAAQRHQVLLFTCHPEDWRDMGVALRGLVP